MVALDPEVNGEVMELQDKEVPQVRGLTLTTGRCVKVVGGWDVWGESSSNFSFLLNAENFPAVSCDSKVACIAY